MKKQVLAGFLALFLTACEKDDVQKETMQVAVPVTMTIADFRASVKITEPVEIEQSGKIYTYGNYIFINDLQKGVLVVDNSNYNPVKKKFLSIPANTDVAIKDDILFANSGRDLVTFDISDLENIKQLERLENVFEDFYPQMPAGAENVDFTGVDYETDIIIGYNLETRERETFQGGWWGRGDTFNGALESGNTGTGGSMARFNIGGDYLYTVGTNSMGVFDISTLSNPVRLSSEYVGWQIETIFNKEGYLYLGSAVGMYIYSLDDPASPAFMSRIQHVMGCDPVVVDKDIAYVTIRGGNECGQNENQLEVIDVSNKSEPKLLEIYQMDGPYGLGIKDDRLFVCDGTSGLKIYDSSNSPELVLTDHFQDVNAYDVIPGESVLIMIGENKLRQYSYKTNEITLISTFDLN
ncbi:MAG TPA: hypothetical protein VK941_01180 [Gillisia sp.]|nr:hypothetical protein [Gillisia sp.]